MLGFTIKTQVPHDDLAEETRVPVFALYVPLKPVIVTRDPVTAFTPPPDTQAVPPILATAFVEIPNQLPCDPDAVVS